MWYKILVGILVIAVIEIGPKVEVSEKSIPFNDAYFNFPMKQ